ncbi:MAG: hypothetical protein Q7J84_13920 [Sulfuricaulis sp.]|nr:hypothetical protein [Sulfuricaulis sp.]
MSDIKTTAARLRAANEKHATWMKSRERLEAERDRLQAASPEIKRQVEAAEAAKADAMARYVGGTAEQAEVTQKRKAHTEADDRLAEHAELLDAILRGIQSHGDFKFEIDAEVKAAKFAFGEALAEAQISIIAANRKLRDELLSAFIAFSYPEGADWSLFLARVFRAPSDDDDFDNRVETFLDKHIRPLSA